jgi:hypothetical protein
MQAPVQNSATQFAPLHVLTLLTLAPRAQRLSKKDWHSAPSHATYSVRFRPGAAGAPELPLGLALRRASAGMTCSALC